MSPSMSRAGLVCRCLGSVVLWQAIPSADAFAVLQWLLRFIQTIICLGEISAGSLVLLRLVALWFLRLYPRPISLVINRATAAANFNRNVICYRMYLYPFFCWYLTIYYCCANCKSAYTTLCPASYATNIYCRNRRISFWRVQSVKLLLCQQSCYLPTWQWR